MAREAWLIPSDAKGDSAALSATQWSVAAESAPLGSQVGPSEHSFLLSRRILIHWWSASYWLLRSGAGPCFSHAQGFVVYTKKKDESGDTMCVAEFGANFPLDTHVTWLASWIKIDSILIYGSLRRLFLFRHVLLFNITGKQYKKHKWNKNSAALMNYCHSGHCPSND